MGDLKKYKVGIVLFFDAEDEQHAIEQFMDEVTAPTSYSLHHTIRGWINVTEETTEGYPRD